MNKIVDIKDRESFIETMIDNSKLGKDYVVLTTIDRIDDFILVDNATTLVDFEDYYLYVERDNIEIIIDLDGDKEESTLVDFTRYKLPNPIVVITSNSDLENILK